MKQYNKNIILLSISLALIIYSMLMLLFNDYILNIKHYCGVALFSFSFFLYLKNKKYYFYLFGTTLVLGVIGMIDFFYISLSISISLLKINPVFVILLILFLVFNKDELERISPSKSISDNRFSQDRIKFFLKDYQDKSDIDLVAIQKSNNHVKEAKIAAETILKDRRRQPN
jgi:hypothetical protein